MDQNPILIQRHHHRKTFAQRYPPDPLFLIHDGGGTVFSYFHLESLGRTVYGISNPHFGTDLKWDNGIMTMAETYTKLIKSTYPSGSILLGGWSLGGILAIQIAHLLSSDTELNVTGIVMIDSTFPEVGKRARERRIPFMAQTLTTTDMAEKTGRCMEDARTQISLWSPPVWRGHAHEIVKDQDRTSSQQTNVVNRPLCPPAILLRATEESYRNSSDSSEASDSEVSGNSKTRALGFDRYENFYLIDVVDTPGDHFSIFNHENVKEMSKKVKAACDTLTKKTLVI